MTHVGERLAPFAASTPHPPSPRRIGIDAGPLLGEGGISEYVRPLLRTLLPLDPDTEYRLILRGGWRPRAAGVGANAMAPVTRVRLPDRLIAFWWDRLGWTLPVHRRLWRSLDLFLATCLAVPVLPRGEVVSIVYDLIPLRLPALFPDRERFRRTMGRLLARSRAVVTISHRTRQDLLELFDADPARVHVIYPGRREGFRPTPPSGIEETLARLEIRGRYLLYVGSLGPHKNVSTLLRAYERIRHGGPTIALVLAGSPRWGEATLTLRDTLASRDDIVVLGSVDAADLPPLYSGAECCVFPSLYEGFGLPVLEAMACGSPVVVSNRGALPEVVGDAGVVVDADDPTAFAAAIRRVLEEPNLRHDHARAGLARAAQFSWDCSARRLLALLRDIAPGEHGNG